MTRVARPDGREGLEKGRLRRRAYEILEGAAADEPAGRILNALLIGLIIANVAAIILESDASIGARDPVWFRLFEWLSVLLFTLEYAVRAWAAVERPDNRYKAPVAGRIRYMLTPLALIDAIAILPFYLSFLLPVDLRFMRVFRLFLIFKLTRYQASMSLLARVVRNEAGPIAAALFVLAMLLVVAASFAYLAEREAQPLVFASIADAMWWAIVTMTTVGYGDMVPVTPLGKVIGGVLGVIGLGMVALPAGLLASGFSEQLHQRRREFEGEIDRILRRGVISPEEGDRLKEIRDRLGLTDHQAAEIMRLMVHRHEAIRCPHCGRSLSPADHAPGDRGAERDAD
jgi:voltage-gated potassium channel